MNDLPQGPVDRAPAPGAALSRADAGRGDLYAGLPAQVLLDDAADQQALLLHHSLLSSGDLDLQARVSASAKVALFAWLPIGALGLWLDSVLVIVVLLAAVYWVAKAREDDLARARGTWDCKKWIDPNRDELVAQTRRHGKTPELTRTGWSTASLALRCLKELDVEGAWIYPVDLVERSSEAGAAHVLVRLHSGGEPSAAHELGARLAALWTLPFVSTVASGQRPHAHMP